MESGADLLPSSSFAMNMNGDSSSSASCCSSSSSRLPDSPIGAIPNSPDAPTQRLGVEVAERTHEEAPVDKMTMATDRFEGKVCLTSIVVPRLEKDTSAIEPEPSAARCRPVDTALYPRKKLIDLILAGESIEQFPSSHIAELNEKLTAEEIARNAINYGIEEEADDTVDSTHIMNDSASQSGKGDAKPKAQRKYKRKPEREREIDEFWRRVNEVVAIGRLPVTCGTAAPAMLIRDLLGSGTKGRSILRQDGSKITPRAYEIEGGLETSVAWLKTIRCLGKPLDALVQRGLLQRHDHHCMCSVCTDGAGNKQPILHIHVERNTSKMKEKEKKRPPDHSPAPSNTSASAIRQAPSTSTIIDNVMERFLEEEAMDESEASRSSPILSRAEQRKRAFERLEIDVDARDLDWSSDDDVKPSKDSRPVKVDQRFRRRKDPKRNGRLSLAELGSAPWIVMNDADSKEKEFQCPEESGDAVGSTFLSAGEGQTVRRRKRRLPIHRFCYLKEKQARLIRAIDHQPGPNDAQEIRKLVRDAILQPENVWCRDLQPLGARQCLDCSMEAANFWCRFAEFRYLRRTKANRLETCDFLMASGSDHSGVVDVSKWLPASTSRLSVTTACYILQNIAPTFLEQLEEQKRLLDMLRQNNSSLLKYMPAWRRSENVRELCDVCQTTLYNLHLFCADCGFAVCNQCVRQRNMQRTRLSESKTADRYDRYQWPYCTRVDVAEGNANDSQFLRMHHPAKLGLVALIPDQFPTTLSTVEQLKARMEAVIESHNIALRCVCGDKSSNERCFCAKPGPSRSPPENVERLCNDGLLILKDPDWEGNLSEFQAHWLACKPVIVANVHDKLIPEMWTPEAFKQSIRVLSGLERSVIDCKTGHAEGWSVNRKNGVTLDEFWDGYSDCTKRKKNKDKVMYLKLKDYPTTASFKEALPKHYEALSKALPLPEYALPEQNGTAGQLNLVTMLPGRYVKPDLGPKMYNAYGMMTEDLRATTNLHLDISDAVNIMVNVTVPKGSSDEYNRRALIAHLKAEGFDEQSADFKRVMRNWKEAGAIWSIFLPSDNGVIRDFILNLPDDLLKELPDDVQRTMNTMDDPIHDQMWEIPYSSNDYNMKPPKLQRFYLTAKLRRHLVTLGVRGCTFVQMLGDAVFIPAGAAHQVQNLFSCIKVAEDFVTPEGVVLSAQITNEFRYLTRQHQNHEDKLQLNNVVHFAVCEAVAALEENLKSDDCQETSQIKD